MRKIILTTIIMFLLLMSIGLSATTDNIIGYYLFNESLEDSTDNNRDLVVQLGSESYVTGGLFDTTMIDNNKDSAYQYTDVSLPNGNTDLTMGVIGIVNSQPIGIEYIMSYGNGGTLNEMILGYKSDNKIRLTFYGASNDHDTPYTLNNGEKYCIIASYQESDNGYNVFVNETNIMNGTNIGVNFPPSTTQMTVSGREELSGDEADFSYDVVGYWNKVLNTTERNDFCNNNLYSDPNLTQETIYQQLISQTQETPVTVVANGYVNIMSGTFNLTEDYFGYASVTLSSYSNLPNSASNCRILIDNQTYDTTIGRTDSSNNNYGSWYLVSSPLNMTKGLVTAELECVVNNGGYTYSGGVGKLNLLNATSGHEIPFLYGSANITINDTEWLKVPLGNITTPNISLKSGYDYSVVYDAVAEVTYNSETRFQVIVEIDGVNYTEKPRDGATGDIGIIGGFIGEDGFSADYTIPINVYIKGDVTSNFKSYAKIFLTHETETSFLDGLNYTVTNTGTFSDYETVPYSSSGVSNVVVESLLPMASTIGQDTLTARFKLDGQNGSLISRTVKTSNKYGALIISNVFSDVPSDDYNVTLQLYSNNGNIIVNNATFNVYKTDIIEFISNDFNITAYNTTGSQINIFNVTTEEGVTIETTNGVVSLSSDKTLLDFNITSNNYYVEVVEDHNILNNYNATMENIIIYKPSFDSFICGNNLTINGNTLTYEINLTYNNPPPIGEDVTVYTTQYTLMEVKKDLYTLTVDNITNSYDYSFNPLYWNIGVYNLSTRHDIRGVLQEYNSSCEFSICKNNWLRKPTACIDEIRIINYTDTNNCQGQYYPDDYGDVEYCSKLEDERKDYWLYMIGSILLYILFIFLGIHFKSMVPFYIGGLIISIFGLLYVSSFVTLSIFFMILGMVTMVMGHRLK